MKVFSDIWEFLSSLTFIDIVFFFLVMILIILVVTLIYFIQINQDGEVKDETAEMKIVKELKDNMNREDSVVINLSDYEKDQEDKAIISYDELLNKSNKYGLNYEREEMHDDVSVKKVNLENINNETDEAPKTETRVISFAKEEAFLEALKRLQKELG